MSSARRLFSSRSATFRAAVLVVAGGLLLFVFSLASSEVRSFYASVAQHRVVQPLQRQAQARFAKKDAAKKEALRQMARQAGSLSSPYVEAGEDEFFPLLVRVWLNADSSHTARVSNNDERFPPRL